MSHWTYIVECGDGTLYTGITTDLERRIGQHNAGTGAKYTRSRRPVVLRWSEEQPDLRSAAKREREIKRLPAGLKRELIEQPRLGSGRVGAAIGAAYRHDVERGVPAEGVVTRVFVYGSRRRGELNHGVLAGAEYAGKATLARAALYDLGAFPAACDAPAEESVVGELYDVGAETLARLDMLEGHPRFYERLVMTATREDGEREPVFAYVLPREQLPRGATRVAGGDWVAYLDGREAGGQEVQSW